MTTADYNRLADDAVWRLHEAIEASARRHKISVGIKFMFLRRRILGEPMPWEVRAALPSRKLVIDNGLRWEK